MKIFVDELRNNEIEPFSSMVNIVFDEFVGKDYSEEGNKTFKDLVEPKNVLERLKNNKFFIAKYNNEIVGGLEIRNDNHVSLFFVKKDFQNKGIGKKLFEYFINTLKQENIGIKIISVNSSIYAEKIYSKMGFIKINEIHEKDGIKYIPMECRI